MTKGTKLSERRDYSSEKSWKISERNFEGLKTQ